MITKNVIRVVRPTVAINYIENFRDKPSRSVWNAGKNPQIPTAFICVIIIDTDTIIHFYFQPLKLKKKSLTLLPYYFSTFILKLFLLDFFVKIKIFYSFNTSMIPQKNRYVLLLVLKFMCYIWLYGCFGISINNLRSNLLDKSSGAGEHPLHIYAYILQGLTMETRPLWSKYRTIVKDIIWTLKFGFYWKILYF